MKNAPILLFGAMGAGKDTVMEMIIEDLKSRGLESQPAKLGKYIRKNVDEMYYTEMAKNHRNAYQLYGEGMCKIFGREHWCKTLVKDHDHFKGESIVIIADARQPHEVSFFKKYDAVSLAIYASEETRAKRLTTRDGEDQTAQMRHSTEISVLTYINACKDFPTPQTFCINNDSVSLNDLKGQVHQFVDEYLKQTVHNQAS